MWETVHFSTCGLEQLSLQIIDCVCEGEDLALLQLEGVWQNRLATFQAHGNINIRNEMRLTQIGQQPFLKKN